MLLDLRKLKRTGKDSADFYFEYTPTEDLAEDLPECEIELPIKVNGTVTLTGDHSAYVEGEVLFTLSGECTRCLKETVNTYGAEFAEQVDDENDGGYSVHNDVIDLTKIVNDAVLMNIPVSFLCDEDCKGICSGCGTNLNDAQCKCKKQ